VCGAYLYRFWWMVEVWCWMGIDLSCWCYIIHILYLILYYTFLFLSWSSDLFFPSPLPIYSPLPSSPILFFLPNIHSILVGTYIYLFILFQYSWSQISDPARSIGVDGWGVWCVFVCSRFWAGVWRVVLYIILYIILYYTYTIIIYYYILYISYIILFIFL
jgi:hypothetical protein